MEAMARLALPSLSTSPAEAHHSGIREMAKEAIRTPGAIRLDVGQPNFPTPKHIGDAGKRAIAENPTFYTHTQGLLSLRQKLAAKLERVNGIRVTPDRIACGPGGAGPLAAVFGAALEPVHDALPAHRGARWRGAAPRRRRRRRRGRARRPAGGGDPTPRVSPPPRRPRRGARAAGRGAGSPRRPPRPAAAATWSLTSCARPTC